MCFGNIILIYERDWRHVGELLHKYVEMYLKVFNRF